MRKIDDRQRCFSSLRTNRMTALFYFFNPLCSILKHIQDPARCPALRRIDESATLHRQFTAGPLTAVLPISGSFLLKPRGVPLAVL
jgi:hypothetical protein